MRRVALTLAMLAALHPALAQQRRPAAPAQPEPPAEQAEPPPPAYESELLRLAEVLGTLSFMTTLCNDRGSDSWRQRMAQLIEAEGATPLRRERLAGSYNRGYLGHQPAHRACSDAARQVIDRMIEQGQRLTHDLATRYSG